MADKPRKTRSPSAKVASPRPAADRPMTVDLPVPLPAPLPDPLPAPRNKPAQRKPTRAGILPDAPAVLQDPADPLLDTLPALAADAPQPVPIFQIHFDPAQRAGLDPKFIPYDNAGQDSPLREFEVFERLAAEEGVRVAPLWGAVSWKFFDKTGLSGEDIGRVLAAYPGRDLYYCNPSTDSEAVYANLWQQGLTVHPGFREICEGVFEAAGLDLRQLDAITPSQSLSSCNYFIGSQAFWASYLPFVRGVVDRARAALPKAMRRMLDSSMGDPRNLHAGASYWPFIVERLLPVFLRGPGAALKVHKIALPAAEAKLNPHLKRLREMKDVAHRTRSLWLYSCWLHYRNLYLLQTAGRDWCVRYLPQLTPAEVVFW